MNRSKAILKYVPSVAASVCGILETMHKAPGKSKKRPRDDRAASAATAAADEETVGERRRRIVRSFGDGDVTEASLGELMKDALSRQDGIDRLATASEAEPHFLKPLLSDAEGFAPDIHHPLFVFRFLDTAVLQRGRDQGSAS